jgi:hypothetical protein
MGVRRSGYDPIVRALAFVLACLAGAMPARAQAPVCEWTGQVALTQLRVQSPPPTRISIVALTGRRAVVSLLSIGLFHVHTVDDAAPIVGTTREPIALAISGVQTFAGIATIASGAVVEGLTPRRAGLRGSIALTDGVRLERVALSCAHLGLASEIASVPIVGPLATGPHWLARARTLRLRVRPEAEAPRLLLTIDDRSRHVFVERDRREGWVRVEALFPQASLSGWVPDTDLARP